MCSLIFLLWEVTHALSRGVQVLENDSDLDAHIAKEEVVYLLLHQSNDQAIVVSSVSSVLVTSMLTSSI